MKLTDLEPEWVNYVDGRSYRRFSDNHSHVHYNPEEVAEGYHDQSEDFAHADGIQFLCPACFAKNNGPIGTESVIAWFRNRPHVGADAMPGPGRWAATGTSFEDLTLSPSINVDHGHWHGFVENGLIRNA